MKLLTCRTSIVLIHILSCLLFVHSASVNFAVISSVSPNTAKSPSSQYNILLNATSPVSVKFNVAITFPSTFTLTAVTGCSFSYNGILSSSATCSLSTSTNVITFSNANINTTVNSLNLVFSTATARYSAVFVATLQYYDPNNSSNIFGSNSVPITIYDAVMGCSLTANSSIVGSLVTYSLTYSPSVTIETSSIVQIQLPQWAPPYYQSNFPNANTSLVCGGQCTITSPNSALGISSEIIKYSSLYSSASSTNFTLNLNSARNPASTLPISIVVTVLSYISSSSQQEYMNCTTTYSAMQPNIFKGITFAPSNNSISGTSNVKMLLNLTNPISSISYLSASFSSSISLAFSYTTSNQQTIPSILSSSSSSLIIGSLTNATALFTTLFLGDFILTNPPYANQPATLTFLSENYANSIYYPVDQISISVTAVPSTIVTASVTHNNSSIAVSASFQITFTTINALISNSFIIVTFPPEITGNGFTCTFSVAGSCSAFNSTSVKAIIGSNPLNAGTNLTITISPLQNPVTTTPSSSFSITTYYINQSTVVDTLFTGLTVTSTPVPLASVFASSSSLVVGSTASFTITIMNQNALPSGSYLTIQFPLTSFPVATPSLTSFQVSGVQQGSNCALSIISPMYFNFTNCVSSSISAGSSIVIVLANLINPLSTKPSDSISVSTYYNNLLMEFLSSGITITVSQTTNLSFFNVTPTNNTCDQTTTYTFVLTFLYTHYSGDRIILTFPSTATLSAGFQCTSSNATLASVNCFQTSSSILAVTITYLTTTYGNSFSFYVTQITNNWYATSATFQVQTTTNATSYYYVESKSATVNFQPATLIATAASNNQIVLLSKSTIKLTISNPFALTMVSNLSLLLLIKIQVPADLVPINSTCTSTLSVCVLKSAQELDVSSITDFTNPLSVTFSANTAYFSPSTATFSIQLYYNNFTVSTNFVLTVQAYCTNPCQSCGSSPTVCLSCLPLPESQQNILFPLNSTCVSACPNTYYINTTISACAPCNSAVCLNCQGSSTNCTSCNVNTYLFGTSCVGTCPNTYYPFASPNQCISCVSPCYNCSNSTVCLSCVGGSYLNWDNTCTQICKNPNFMGLNGLCQQCTNNCLTCAGSLANCTSCSSNHILNSGSCISTCVDGQFNNSNSVCQACVSPCLYCTSATICRTCVSGYYLYNSTQCVNPCPPSTFSYVDTCTNCNSSCATCNGTSTFCTSCPNGLYYYLSQCLVNCPVLTYPYQGTCTSCAHPCATCLDNSAYLCSSCFSGLLLNASCVQSCPSVGYLTTNTTCIQCQANCLQCLSSVNCITCGQNYYLLDGSCQQTCPTNYPIVINRSCTACESQCATCQTNSDYCLTCTVQYFKFSYTCVLSCPLTYYSNIQTYTCENGLSSKIVFFPVAISFLVLIFVISIIKCITPITSWPTVISAFSILLEPCIWALLLSFLSVPVKEPDINYMIPIALGAVPFVTLLIGNILFFWLNRRKLAEDQYVRKWSTNNINYTVWFAIRYASLGLGHKIFRLIYSKLFNSLHLSMVPFKKDSLFSLSTAGTFFHLLFCQIPFLAACFFLAYFKVLKDQLFYTSVEGLFVTVIAIVISLIDIHKSDDYFEDTEFMRQKRYVEKVKDSSLNKIEDGEFFEKDQGSVEGEKYVGLSGGKFLISKQDLASLNEMHFEETSEITDALESAEKRKQHQDRGRNSEKDSSEKDMTSKSVEKRKTTDKKGKKNYQINIFEPIKEEEAEHYEREKYEQQEIKTLAKIQKEKMKLKSNQEDEYRERQMRQQRFKEMGMSNEQIQEMDYDNMSLIEERQRKGKWNSIINHREQLARQIFNTVDTKELARIQQPQNEDQDDEGPREHNEIRLGTVQSVTGYRRKLRRKGKKPRGNKQLQQIYLQRLTEKSKKNNIFASSKSLKYDF